MVYSKRMFSVPDRSGVKKAMNYPKKPMVMATPLPTTAAKFAEDASTVWPPEPLTTPLGGLRKSNTNWNVMRLSFASGMKQRKHTSESVNTLIRSTFVGARRSSATSSAMESPRANVAAIMTADEDRRKFISMYIRFKARNR